MRYAIGMLVIGALMLACIACGGCLRSITYVHRPDGVIEARYTNFGFDTSIDGLRIHKTDKAVDVEVQKFNSEAKVAQTAAEAGLAAAEAAREAAATANKVAK